MNYQVQLGIVANWAAILTAVIATIAYGRFLHAQFSQKNALENYLRTEKETAIDGGQRTVLHLMSNLSLTEAEVLSAAFRSKKIHPAVSVDEKGHADRIMFEYSGTDLRIPEKF